MPIGNGDLAANVYVCDGALYLLLSKSDAYGDNFKLLRSQGIYTPLEKSWQEKGDRIYEAEKKIMPNYKDELQRLSNEINIDKPHLTVYNALPWPRSGSQNKLPVKFRSCGNGSDRQIIFFCKT